MGKFLLRIICFVSFKVVLLDSFSVTTFEKKKVILEVNFTGTMNLASCSDVNCTII